MGNFLSKKQTEVNKNQTMQTNTQNAIELHQLTKHYGDKTAVNSVSLSVKKGEIFSFLGINGAGKTTTLQMLVGILRPTSGSIHICGYDLQTNIKLAKSITGYIPDRPYIYSKLTAWEFLQFTSQLYSVTPADFAKRGTELLEEYSLSEVKDDLVESFSHGMKQRLATCASIIHKPQVLIVDEPIVGLDPHGAKKLKESLRAYANSGMTIFLSTHSSQCCRRSLR